MLNPNFFNTVFVFPILNLLVTLYHVFRFLRIPGDFGFAIIGLTVFVRLILHPFFKQQLETSKKMQDLKPHLDNLSKKHKQDPKKLQQEQLKLYQQAGINPASGCLFMIVQIPVFIALYNTLSLFLSNGKMDKVLVSINNVLYSPLLKISSINPWFFGFNLALSPAQAMKWHYYLIPVVTAALQYMQAVVTTAVSPSSDVKKEDKELKPASAKDAAGQQGDFQKVFNTQMKYIFPLMIGWFSYNLPVGLALYWNIFSIFSIIQYQGISKKSLPSRQAGKLQNPKSK